MTLEQLALVSPRVEIKPKEPLDVKSIPIIVLMGGRGSRIEPMTQGKIPKPLVCISDGRTLLDLNLEIFRRAGAENIILAVAHQKEQIITYVQNKGLNEVKISDQKEPKGIPDAIARAIDEHRINSDFIACDGDGLRFGLDISRLIEEHNHRRGIAIFALAKVADPFHHYGVELEPHERITSIVKFPDPHHSSSMLVHTGLILFSERACGLFKKPREDKAWDSIYNDLISTGQAYGIELPNVTYFNVNTPQVLSEMESWLAHEGGAKLN